MELEFSNEYSKTPAVTDPTILNKQRGSKTNQSLAIRSNEFVHNTFLNFIGQAVPLMIGIVSIPFIVSSLGTERFGLLALVWAVLGYFSVFDFGRATTKFVAEALGNGQIEKVRQYVWITVLSQGALGFVGLLVLAVSASFLVGSVLKISPQLIGEARTSFYVLAGSVPVVLVSSSLRGVLEAGQRFDRVNAVRIPSSAAHFLLPLLGTVIGLNLPGIVLLILVSKTITLFALGMLCLKTFPVLKRMPNLQAETLRLLLRFGFWVTISNALTPVLFYLDRFVIASLISMASVGYYVASYELVSRLSIFSTSIVATLFPALSYMGVNSCREDLERVYAGSIKYLLLLMGPATLALILFAKEILAIWLGSDFAESGTVVVRIVSVGMLMNLLAWIPYTLLQSLGRPDVSVKFLLFQFPTYFGFAWLCTKHLDIEGTAIAWALILGLGNCLFAFLAVWKIFSLSPRIFVDQGFAKPALTIAILVAACVACLKLSFLARAILGALWASVFVVVAWYYLLDVGDRKYLFSGLNNSP